MGEDACICRHSESPKIPAGREGHSTIRLERECPYHAPAFRVISQDHWSWARSGPPPWEFTSEMVDALMKAHREMAEGRP